MTMRWLNLISFLFPLCLTAQVSDDFTDGDFTASPAWSGDNTEFTVNASNELQLNNSVAGASYLSVANAMASIDNTEWHFYIKQAFASSGSNYGRVYLVSDQANLEGALNGYYLQFGEAGSLDAVELFRQTGTTSTSVCRGTNGSIAAAFNIGVKVTRDASGLWNLYVDPSGGAAYTLQASGTDNTYTTTSYFGVTTLYTVTNATKFYFDNFYVGNIIVDLTPPSIVSSTVISNTQVDVLFNEAVDLTTSQTTSNYSADNGLGNPSVATRDAGNLALVHLTFATAFTNGLLNTLTVTNVQDLNSNTITSANTTFTYFAPIVAVYKDVIINEIFADPSPQIGLPAVEYIELYNKSSNTINLNGWKFTDGSSTATLGTYYLGANQYLIVCSVADTASFTSFGATMGVSSFPSLNNSGDDLKLKDNSLTVIDSVNYSDTWYQDATKKDGGYSLELINPLKPAACPQTGNWIASNNSAGGTPGMINSVYNVTPDLIAPTVISVYATDSVHISLCFSEAIDMSILTNVNNYSVSGGIGIPSNAIADTSSMMCVELTTSTVLNLGTFYNLTVSSIADCSGNTMPSGATTFSYYKARPFDIVINEIMVDPDPIFSSLPNYEYVELFNRTPHTIDLNGWKFSAGSNTKTLPDVRINANGYIVLASTTAAPNYPASYNVVGMTSFPALTNSGQTLTLKNTLGNTISTVSYTDDWYRDDTKKEGGWSLEQIDPNNPCAGADNWIASVSTDAGTPGSVNSVNASHPDNVAPQIVRVSVIATDTIQVFFNEPLDSTTLLNTSLYSIDNSIGNPSSVKPVAPDFKSAVLTLVTPLQNDIIYTITVGNTITDCIGNPVSSGNTARFAIPKTAQKNDIVINEILFDPKTGGYDFVEIYNRSNKVIDLKTLTLSQYDTINNVLTSIKTISTDGYLLFPSEYLVLSVNGTAVKTQYNTTNPNAFLDLPLMISMNISGGTVCIARQDTVIDLLKYYDNMHFALLNDTKGVSLERIDFERPTQDRTNWHSAAEAAGFATPGYKNSQYNDAGETDDAIQITPEIFSPDEDGYNDIVNINYHFDAPGYVANVMIYDSKGRMIKNLIRNELLGTKGTFSWDGVTDEREKARIGIYILFVEIFDLNGNVKHYKKTCVVGGKL